MSFVSKDHMFRKHLPIAVVASNKYSIARNLYQLDVSLPIQYHSTAYLSLNSPKPCFAVAEVM